MQTLNHRVSMLRIGPVITESNGLALNIATNQGLPL